MQNHEEVSRLVMREINDIVYIADVETYELLFLNHRAMKLIDIKEGEKWQGKPCYKILQNFNEPCEFCSNAYLNKEEFYCWEHYNQTLKRHFYIKDKLVEWDGRLVRLEIAVDNTDKERIYRQLESNLNTEKTLVSCIRTLSMNSDLTAAIQNLLEIIGKYYQGERAYIFECDHKNKRLVNTYEWCKDGIEPLIDSLKKLPLPVADRWTEEFQKAGVARLITAPLLEKEEIIGLIGVDNPAANREEMVLLQSVAFFVADDIKKKKITSQLKELSYKDTLTGAWNRNKYMETLYEFEGAAPARLGIIYADINGLKRANDIHGHQYGDHIICRAAEMLEEVFQDRVYRIGGDEFIILCTNLSYNEFNVKVDRLYERIRGDEECSLSIGLKWAENEEGIIKQIISADKLMYAEKQRYYSTRQTEKCSHKAALSVKLLKEIQEGRFFVYFQPQIELQTGKLHGAEALVRKTDGNKRIEAPIQFIPRYEAEGIIRHVDFFVLERVCQLLSSWKTLGNNDLKVSVNLSRFTLMEYRITEKIQRICSRYEIPASRIVIEVTETLGQMDKEELRLLMTSLRKAGFTVSLDDFGAEYSNLAILVSLQFNEIKLDKSLIDNIVNNQRSKIVTTHAIELCKELEVTTSVAEGIETEEQLNMLKALKCDVGQGYLFDKPLSEEHFEKKYIQYT